MKSREGKNARLIKSDVMCVETYNLLIGLLLSLCHNGSLLLLSEILEGSWIHGDWLYLMLIGRRPADKYF